MKEHCPQSRRPIVLRSCRCPRSRTMMLEAIVCGEAQAPLQRLSPMIRSAWAGPFLTRWPCLEMESAPWLQACYRGNHVNLTYGIPFRLMRVWESVPCWVTKLTQNVNTFLAKPVLKIRVSWAKLFQSSKGNLPFLRYWLVLWTCSGWPIKNKPSRWCLLAGKLREGEARTCNPVDSVFQNGKIGSVWLPMLDANSALIIGFRRNVWCSQHFKPGGEECGAARRLARLQMTVDSLQRWKRQEMPEIWLAELRKLLANQIRK